MQSDTSHSKAFVSHQYQFKSQLSGPCELDLGSGSRSYHCASLIKFYLYTKFDKDRIVRRGYDQSSEVT